MQIQPPPTKEQIASIVETKRGHDGMPAPLKILVATNLLVNNHRMIPKFWIQCETRTLVEKGMHKRTWRQYVAGLPKTFTASRYKCGEVYLPVFATSFETDQEKGTCQFDLTRIEHKDVGFDFKPVAMIFNLAAAWWRCKFDEEATSDWGPVPYIDGQLGSSFRSSYTFTV